MTNNQENGKFDAFENIPFLGRLSDWQYDDVLIVTTVIASCLDIEYRGTLAEPRRVPKFSNSLMTPQSSQ